MGDLLGSAPDTTVLDKIITEALEASSDLQGQEQITVADNVLNNQQAISNLLIVWSVISVKITHCYQ